MADPASTTSGYTPKLASAFAEGYRLEHLRRDAMAGLTVAIVALPLSMAIAVASGVSPDRGLYAAIVGGFIVSALGGSRFQIGGPAGAFIVLVSATVAQHGVDGLMLTVLLSGIMLTLVGALRLGGLIRLIPHAVTVGFTAGVAVVIAASQFKDFLGLSLQGPEPGALIPKLRALGPALPTLSWATAGLALLVVGLILGVRRWRPSWPSMLIAVAAATALAASLHLPVETIGGRFGGIPQGLPMPRLPELGWSQVAAVLPAAFAFTLLGGIESLLSAVVADSMTGRRHRSNMELVAQGLANVASAMFGGLAVTGTVARTATNIRAGAHSPVAGILHAVFLLAFLVLAAPVASYTPLAALAGVLVVVAWNMAEKAEFGRMLRGWRTGTVLMATFLLTILHDLIAGIGVGCALAGVFWLLDRRGLARRGPPDRSGGPAI